MTAEERASLARAKRASIIAQRAMGVLGGAQQAYRWLMAPCPALRGKAPADLRYDIGAYRRVQAALRRRERRMRVVRTFAKGSFAEERAYQEWLWSRCRAIGGRLPAMMLDTESGAQAVVRAIPTGRRRRAISGD